MSEDTSKAAVALNAKRWAATTEAERREVGKRLAAARWGKRRKVNRNSTVTASAQKSAK